MRVSRRTVLLMLSTVTAGAGGVFASGAFSSVKANRSVNVNTTDDSTAILKFEAQSPGGDNIIANEDVSGSGSTVITIEQNKLNEQATTIFKNALRVTNDGGRNVGLSVVGTANNNDNLVGDGETLDIQHNGNSIVNDSNSTGNPVNLDADGGNKLLDVEINLRDGNAGDPIDKIEAIVFAAREEDYSLN